MSSYMNPDGARSKTPELQVESRSKPWSRWRDSCMRLALEEETMHALRGRAAVGYFRKLGT